MNKTNARMKALFLAVVVMLAGGGGLLASHSVQGWPVDLPSTTSATASRGSTTGVLEAGSVVLSGIRGSLTFYSEPPPPPPNATAPPPVSGETITENTTYISPTNPPSTLNDSKSGDPPVNPWGNSIVTTLSTPFVADSAEPSVAANGSTVFYTWNWGASLSSKTPPFMNPYSDINGNGGKPGDIAWFCCDQDVVYAPDEQVFLWYRQACGGDPTNVCIIGKTPPPTQLNRLSVVTSSGVECEFTFGPSTFGLDSHWYFDYPQLALGHSFLYITTNMFGDGNEGTIAIRFPLTQLADCAAGTSVTISPAWIWYHYNGCFPDGCPFISMAPVSGPAFMNGLPMFFAGHASNSVLKIWEWPEGGAVQVYNVNHPPFEATNRGDASCPVSDGTDPCKKLDDRILGGFVTESGGVADWLYFYWNVKQGNGFPFPWTYVVILNPLNPTYCPVNCAIQIWSKSNALVFASITPNMDSLNTGFVGVTLVAAGGTTSPSTALAITKPFSLAGPFQIPDPGTNGPKSGRWGDFVRIRPYYGDSQVRWGGSWVASGFRKTNATAFELHVYFLSPVHVPPTITILYPTGGSTVDLTPGHANPDFAVQVTDPQGVENCLSMSNLAWHSDVDGINFASSCDFSAGLANLGKLLSPGVQRIHVTATDKEGETLTSNSVTFTLIIPQPTVVITNPSNNEQIPQGQQVTLQGVAYQSPQDEANGVPPIDCSQLAWSWFDPSGLQIGGACGANGKSFELPYTFNTIGQGLTFTLKAAYGKVSLLNGASATVTVNVAAKSSSLYVSITPPPYNGWTYYATSGPLQLTGTVSGGTGTYPSITWEADWASGTYTIATGTLSYSWNIAGTLCQNPNFTPAYASTLPVTIKLTATDTNGNTGSRTVTVNLGCQIVGAINFPLPAQGQTDAPALPVMEIRRII